MAKIFRISGYLVTTEKGITPKIQMNRLYGWRRFYEEWQQLHIEESEEFDLDGEDKSDCDLALLTRHFKADKPVVEYDRPLPQAGEKYRHFKIGKVVTIVGISRHTETEEIDVVYDYEGKLWCRPLDMLMSEVDRAKYPNATQKYRFESAESDDTTGLTETEAMELIRMNKPLKNRVYNKAVDMATGALSKQIPKLVDRDNGGATGWCPVCGSYLSKTWNRHYCGNCGQRLE